MKNNLCCLAIGGLALLVSSFLLTGCLDSSSSDTGNKTETRNLDLNFRALNTTISPTTDITDDVCGATLKNLGTQDTNATIDYLAFYVSEVKLVTSAGQRISVALADNHIHQEQGVALVDFRNQIGACDGAAKPVQNTVLGSYQHKEGTNYTGLEFTLGLPPAINHADANPNGILSKAVDMHWNWLNGYRYLRFDIAPEGGVTNAAGGSTNRWNLHLGATSCSNPENDRTAPPSTPCDNPNLPDIQLTGFNPDTSDIGVDIAAVFAGNDLTKDTANPVGCMSGTTDPECGEVFARLGLRHPRQENVTAAINQVVFSVLND